VAPEGREGEVLARGHAGERCVPGPMLWTTGVLEVCWHGAGVGGTAVQARVEAAMPSGYLR